MLNKKEEKAKQIFRFKQFDIAQENCAMKIGTDGVLLGAWIGVGEATKQILDIGTGTGVIAIMLAQRALSAKIIGVEIDTLACAQARANMEASPWKNRLVTIESSIQDYANDVEDCYDLIVSNPPFFTGGTLSTNQSKRQVRHTIKLPTADLLNVVGKLLSPKGQFCVILPPIEGEKFITQAAQYNLHCSKITEVHAKVEKKLERVLLQFERVVKLTTKDRLVIQKGGRHQYTKDYIELTKAFYLNM